ncbi:MAG: polyprenyl synthetase family protein [Saprospiraceae bacterium]|jgi:octaprenyl-diphosphate synthase
MTLTLDAIKAPVTQELEAFEQHFREAMRSKVPLLDKITFYIVRRKGKQVRPVFVFLAAGMIDKVQEGTHRAASLIELLHTATLVHDDVVDDSLIRRGFFSINALWKNKIAVLVGDYLLSQGLLLALKNKEYLLLEIVSEAVKSMSEGELLQIEKARKLDIEEEVYYEIIRQKTASLIGSACSAGAASAGASEEEIEKMRVFGEKIGIAFQIRDDLFDFGSEDVGKPLGIDIKEKKMTLPLIYALNQSSEGERKRIIQIIRKNSKDTNKVKEVIDFVLKSGGMEYAKTAMHRYRDEAIEILRSFKPSIYRDSLENLVFFVTNRKK